MQTFPWISLRLLKPLPAPLPRPILENNQSFARFLQKPFFTEKLFASFYIYFFRHLDQSSQMFYKTYKCIQDFC